jgi:hypothetical protein
LAFVPNSVYDRTLGLAAFPLAKALRFAQQTAWTASVRKTAHGKMGDLLRKLPRAPQERTAAPKGRKQNRQRGLRIAHPRCGLRPRSGRARSPVQFAYFTPLTRFATANRIMLAFGERANGCKRIRKLTRAPEERAKSHRIRRMRQTAKINTQTATRPPFGRAR